MRKISYIFIILMGLISLVSCNKDENKATLMDTPIAPVLSTVPNLTFSRDHATDIVNFVGTSVKPGFKASANYYLEAAVHGTNFKDSVVLYSGSQDSLISFSIKDLNQLLLKKLDPNTVTSIDMRIRSVLVLSGGSNTTPFYSLSNVKTADATVYGLIHLDLIGSGITQRIESPLGDGKYTSYVKLQSANSFTLSDVEGNKTYGGANSVLSENGAAISVGADGWYQLDVDTKALTYKIALFNVCVAGDGEPTGGWNGPSPKMDYDIKQGCFVKTLDLVAGNLKFKLNDDWGTNWGGKGKSDGSADNYTDATTVPMSAGGKNIPLPLGPGNYTLKFYIGQLSLTIVKN